LQSGSFQHRVLFSHQLRWPFARGNGDLLLPKPVRSVILTPERPGTWRECRVIKVTSNFLFSDYFVRNLKEDFGT
jgi:hypothetical protein